MRAWAWQKFLALILKDKYVDGTNKIVYEGFISSMPQTKNQVVNKLYGYVTNAIKNQHLSLEVKLYATIDI